MIRPAHRGLRGGARRGPVGRRGSHEALDIEQATRLVTGGALSEVFRTLAGLPALWVAA